LSETVYSIHTQLSSNRKPSTRHAVGQGPA